MENKLDQQVGIIILNGNDDSLIQIQSTFGSLGGKVYVNRSVVEDFSAWRLGKVAEPHGNDCFEGNLKEFLAEEELSWLIFLFLDETPNLYHLGCLTSLLRTSSTPAVEILICDGEGKDFQYGYQKRVFRSESLPSNLPPIHHVSELRREPFASISSVRSCWRVTGEDLLTYGFHKMVDGEMHLSSFSPLNIDEILTQPSYPSNVDQCLERLTFQGNAISGEELSYMAHQYSWSIPVMWLLGRIYLKVRNEQGYINTLYYQTINLSRPFWDFSYPFSMSIFREDMLEPLALSIALGYNSLAYERSLREPSVNLVPYQASYMVDGVMLLNQNVYTSICEAINRSFGFRPQQFPLILAKERAEVMGVELRKSEWWTVTDPILFLEQEVEAFLKLLHRVIVPAFPSNVEVVRAAQGRSSFFTATCLLELRNATEALIHFLSGKGKVSFSNRIGTGFTYIRHEPG